MLLFHTMVPYHCFRLWFHTIENRLLFHTILHGIDFKWEGKTFPMKHFSILNIWCEQLIFI